MGDLIQFVPRSTRRGPPPLGLVIQAINAQAEIAESERMRMIAEARAQYQAIFPDDLRAVGERIIRSPEFHDEIAKSEKDDAAFPFDPVCVAIMRGHGQIEDASPCERNPENLV